jgi:6-phosphogluconolactonase
MRWIFLALCFWCAPLFADSFVYISDSKQNVIKIYRLDVDHGALQGVGEYKVEGAPGSLTTDPKRRFLFASIRSNNTLASFAIDRDSGKLALIGSTKLDTAANAAYVSTDRTGKFLFSASYAAGRVVAHAVDEQGRLSERPLQVVQTEKTAHACVFDPQNQWLLVPHVAPNAIYQFRFHADTGQITALDKVAGGKEQAGPRHLAFHPSGKFACSSDEQGSSVTLYSFDSKQGLQPLQTLSTLPDSFMERNTTADVKFHPSGKYAWVSNRGHDSLAGFAFDDSASRLTALGTTSTEKTPRSFDIDPSGKFLFAGGEGTGKLASYRIDHATGQLSPLQAYEVGQSLSWVVVVPTSDTKK